MNENKENGRRFNKKVDGPTVMKWYAKMPTPALAQKMALKAKPAESTYVFTSFDTRPLRYIKEHYPESETGLITGEGVNHETIAIALAIGAKRMAAHINKTSRADMDRAHRKGLLVNLWPGKSDDSLLRAWALGADIHCTDYPSHMLDYAKKNCPWLTIK